MSTMWFQDRNQTAWVAGFERPYFGMLLHGIFWTVLNPLASEWLGGRASCLRSMIGDSKIANLPVGEEFAKSLREQTFVNPNFEFLVNGVSVSAFVLAANTALVIGNDIVRLVARLDGQIELDPYVEGTNRAWLAEIIETALRSHVLRDDGGWRDVVSLLRRSSRSPVLMGDNTCSSPARSPSTFLRRVRERRSNGQWSRIEFAPASWEGFRFRDGSSVFDLAKPT